MTRHGNLLRIRGFLLLLAGAVGLLSLSLAHASETKSFSIPASTAERSLREFSSQSGVELVYPGEIVRGVRTPAVTGDLTAGEALSRLLRGTGLTSVQDEKTGAFSIARATDPNVRRAAQATPGARPRPNSATTAVETAEEKTIQLTPFVVNDDQDVGYIASNTLAGSRLNTPLKDTAASLSVLTAEFIQDLGANSIEEAMAWSTNSQLDVQDTGGLAGSTADDNSTFYSFTQHRIRGLPATSTRNYFAWRLPSDSYNLERIEEARGPNSILFGIGSAGGVINASTKQARFGRNIRRAGFQVNNSEGYRGTIDLNQQVGQKLAFRLNGVFSHQPSHREAMKNDNRNVHLAGAFKVLEKTRLRAEYETGIIDQVVGANDTVTDQFSNWTTRGKPLITTPPTPTAAQLTALGATAHGTATQVYYIQNNNSLINLAGTFRTVGSDNFAGELDPSLGHFSVHTGGDGSTRRADFDTASIFLEQQIGRNTFVELSYNRQDNSSRAYQPAGNSRRLYGDPTTHYSNGQTNPFVGEFLLEGETWTWDVGRKSENLRATVATDLDFGKWGKYRLAGLVEKEERRNPDGNMVEVWADSPYHADPENAANQVHRRNYVTPGEWGTFYRSMPKNGLIQGLRDPITGRTLNSTMVPRLQTATRDVWEDQDTKLVAAQARFFKDRLVFGVGYRWDTLEIENYGSLRNPTTRFWEVDYAATTSSSSYDGRTKTFGVVGHVTKNISAFYNKSDNFGLPGSQRILPDSLPPPNPESVGEDMGISLDLFNGKVIARASYYKVNLNNGANFNYGGTLTNPSSISRIILDALVNQSIITEAQATPHRSQSTGATFNRLVEGYELNLTANPTRNWSLSANFSFTDGMVSNVAPEVKQWIADHMPFLQTPAYQNVVTGNAAMSVAAVIEDFFEYHQGQLDSEGLVLPGNRKYKANLFTAYTFSQGRLKGLRVGGGYTWQSKMPVGLVNVSDLRYGNALWNTNAMVSYRFRNIPRLEWIKNLRLQLNVYNVTDDNEPTIYRYASNDPTNAGYNVIRRVRTKEPRTWRLSADFDF
jgi:iron complex outermembrane receptor protein